MLSRLKKLPRPPPAPCFSKQGQAGLQAAMQLQNAIDLIPYVSILQFVVVLLKVVFLSKCPSTGSWWKRASKLCKSSDGGGYGIGDSCTPSPVAAWAAEFYRWPLLTLKHPQVAVETIAGAREAHPASPHSLLSALSTVALQGVASCALVECLRCASVTYCVVLQIVVNQKPRTHQACR